MHYVYILKSINFPKERHTGYSDDLKTRLRDHNSEKSVHTNKFKPWKLVSYFAFDDLETAKNFEVF